jgi:hypothetical protein
MRHAFFGALVASLWMGGCAASVETDETATNEAAASASSCRWKCQKCRPGFACIQVCEPIGNCGSQCTAIALCVEGYTWDDKTCACVPVAPGGESCGASTCGEGQVCCNSSCGICTAPGDFCTMQMCDSVSE